MFSFIQNGKDYFVSYPDGEMRALSSIEIEKFYQRINSVIDLLGLKEDYYKSKEEEGKSLLEFAIENDIDLDACLYSIITSFKLEKPLV